MSVRSDVLLWAQRICAKKGAPAHQLLEIEANAELDTAQEAFHKIARLAHPDLHRNSLTPEEIELVTTAYSRIAAAYQEVRMSRRSTGRMRPLKPDPPPPRPLTQPPPIIGAAGGKPISQPPPLLSQSARPVTQPPPLLSQSARPVTQPPPLSSRPVTMPPPLRTVTQPVEPVEAAPAADPAKPITSSPAAVAASAMSSKALIYYRKAELSLRRGDLKGAVLQLKLAIASDPQSTFLRSALAEVEAEVSK